MSSNFIPTFQCNTRCTGNVQIWFLNRVVHTEKVMEEAKKLAAIKQSVRTNLGSLVKEALNRKIELSMTVFINEDVKEGPKAFKEKRNPVFKAKQASWYLDYFI